MGTFDWAVDLAKEMIDENGESAPLTVYSTTTPDPAYPNETGKSDETVVPARAVFLNYNAQESGQTYSDGTTIHRDDKKVLVAAKGLVADPNINGIITRANGDVFRIIKIKQLDPAGDKIFFELQARR